MLVDSPVYDATREKCVNSLEPIFFGSYLEKVLKDLKLAHIKEDSMLLSCLKLSAKQPHVMHFTYIRVIEAFFSLIRKGVDRVVEFNVANRDFPLSDAITEKFIRKWAFLTMVWAFVGDTKLAKRAEFYDAFIKHFNISLLDLPKTNENITLIDYTVELKTGDWVLWKDLVPSLDLDEKSVTSADTIITTVDTLRHQLILCSWLLENRPFIICGPPGSGKTMTLMSTLRSLPDFEMIFVNFSSGTDPELILKQFEHYCEYAKSTKGVTLRPK